ncbi:MAG: HD domain-containing protein [Lachnospiraceae bacterium]|nr:HD domain-containing protein [Lachnospiraceae bacterium]
MPCLPVLMSLACEAGGHIKWAVITLSIHAALEWLFLPFHLIISMDSTGFYHRGPLYFIYIFIDVVSLIYMLVAFSRLSGKYGTKKTATLWMIVVVMFSALIPSVISGKCHTSILGVTLCAIILYEYYQSLIQRELSEKIKKQQESLKRLFEQTATALVNAIDAKDKYTHGHSARVADYSRKIAEVSGKSEEECEEIYFSALLHDVGKIGIPIEIINKNGRLTDEEYETIKKHPVIGEEILSSISEYPYLSVAAHYHHERYDGKGYPTGLKGEDIPEIARIVAVADSYDAMTSKRSYRDSIPQSKVREEIVKGAGSQFDPVFAHTMQHIIDLDTEYVMRERGEVKELAGRDELDCDEFRSSISDGIYITANKVHIRLRCTPRGGGGAFDRSMPALILFDSNDGRYYSDERKQRDLHYYEYGEIWYDGHTSGSGVRDMQTSIEGYEETGRVPKKGYVEYSIEAVRYKDHALIVIDGNGQKVRVTVALPDSTRFLYLGLTGQYCRLTDVKIDKSEEAIGEGYIKRIAEEISYINVPAGDIPNVQIDGYRADATEGIPIRDGLEIRFHSMSLPTATLIWHCPYITIYHSSDKKVSGKDYREFALIRIDGESWVSDDNATNDMYINKKEEFKGWEDWKAQNRAGIDCVFSFAREGNTITTTTENMGIYIKTVTTIDDNTEDVYAAITGDQVALTNIRIM